MQNNRYNPYTYIHKGIRRELAHLLRTAGNLDFSDEPEARAFIAGLRNSLRLMNKHAHHEDLNVDPVLTGFAPKLARRITATHKVLEEQEREVLSLCENAPGEEYGEKRFRASVRRAAALDAGEMRDAIVSDANAFFGETLRKDDITLVIGKIS